MLYRDKQSALGGYPFRRIAWTLSLPIRLYLQKSPWSRGKGLLQRQILYRILPGTPSSFTFKSFDGTSIVLQHHEVLGASTLISGEFERAERQVLASLVEPGTTAIDVGANVGIFSLSLAKAVGSAGFVLAFEPITKNASRLSDNIRLNGFQNVKVFVQAASESDEPLDMFLASDPAFHSAINDANINSEVTRVPSSRLDSIWEKAGRPNVSAMKIDVEGAEKSVVLGATILLRTCRPALLLEAASAKKLQELDEVLKPLGYQKSHPSGFLPWNYLFISVESPT